MTTNGWQTWADATTTVDLSEGIQDLKLEFTGGTGFLFNVNRFKFEETNTLSIDEFAQLNVEVYPNPIIDSLTIINSGELKKFTVLDLKGGILKNIKAIKGTSKINFSDFSSGMYILRDNDSGATLKLIKK